MVRTYPLSPALLIPTFNGDCEHLGVRPARVLEIPCIDTRRMNEAASVWLAEENFYLLFSPPDEALPTSNCVSLTSLIFLAGLPKALHRWHPKFTEIYATAFPKIYHPGEFDKLWGWYFKKNLEEYEKALGHPLNRHALPEILVENIKKTFRMKTCELAVKKNTHSVKYWIEDKSHGKKLLRVNDVFDMAQHWNTYSPPEIGISADI